MRTITGMAAVLLPFDDAGAIDWPAFDGHVARTRAAGLVPAVNMDTGFGAVLDPGVRRLVLDRAGPGCVCGVYVDDAPGAALDLDGYRRAITEVEQSGATPIVFPSWGLHGVPEGDLPGVFAAIARDAERFLAFELGAMFVPHGRIYSLATFEQLLALPQCIGAKHSSLERGLEWERLALRDLTRPDFMVLTGNDRAIDMVVHGSDYLLGLATFAPDWFAARDRAWADGERATFWERNDLLQYLGQFAFRDPVPAYRHSAAQFLRLRGWLSSSRTHPASPTRPESDVAVLEEIIERAQTVFGA
jgi:dihydrodipicolinate synthase/N-acetylneuraminate lyase